VAEDAGRFCDGYAPESVFVSAPLEDVRPFASDHDAIAVVDLHVPVTFVEMVTYPLSAKVLILSSKLGDSAGRMCVWRAGARSCVIGNIAAAVMLAT
jgi:hypothetical protein